MFTIHQKRFSILKKTFISFFTNGANRPGVNRPVRKIVLERIVPGGTGFGANRPVTGHLDNHLDPGTKHFFLFCNEMSVPENLELFTEYPDTTSVAFSGCQHE